MNRRHPLPYLIIVFIYCNFFVSYASTRNIPAGLDSLVLSAKNNLYNFRIHRVDLTINKMIKEYPSFPQGYLNGALLTLIRYSQDMTNDSLALALNRQADRAADIATAFSKKHPKDAGARLNYGLAQGLKGVYAVIRRSYFKGYWYGKKAKGAMEDAVKMDSTCYDAYLGLGIFHYYASLLPGFTRFLAGILGFPGNKELGKKEILKTAEKGRYLRAEARFSYYTIRYFLEGAINESIHGLKKMAEKYPTNYAITLFLGYHYRHRGNIPEAMTYFRSVPDSFMQILPQVTQLKYYNLGVCHFYLNEFNTAEHFFNILKGDHYQESRYYQAGINYYKGLLEDLAGNRKVALYYYNQIHKYKDTKYWYYAVRLFREYPMDSLMRSYVLARNQMFRRKFRSSMAAAKSIFRAIAAGRKYTNKLLPVLAADLLGSSNYALGNFRESRLAYERELRMAQKMDDKFIRSWYLIHYARVLREMGQLKLAGEWLSRADKVDDDYTKIIITRDRYLLKMREKQTKQG